MTHTCPSGQATPGATLLGIMGPGGRVVFTPHGPALTSSLRTHLQAQVDENHPGAPLESRYRFATPCATKGCAFWDGTCRALDAAHDTYPTPAPGHQAPGAPTLNAPAAGKPTPTSPAADRQAAAAPLRGTPPSGDSASAPPALSDLSDEGHPSGGRRAPADPVSSTYPGITPSTNPALDNTIALPHCGIRDTCRWWSQEGPTACAVCPQVRTRAAPIAS
ncbi:hypothetical protein [Actinokineospora terrae]|uniref:Uncharacterized protein n=1 Tax=Actinokineospora terrae TaxID=155974 RepID=A0A1H9WDZ3_9PSEU|nr:hypothetical protein [Actinokineospora terrae]SES32009.1 hypothetical protein SAMN04487818_110107 [Actinokineospora terrae]